MKYDLEERVIKFGENIISFTSSIQINTINKPLINQLIKSGTSLGANYMEANGASSKKDFRNKIFISKKEANESRYWLRIISKAVPEKQKEADALWKEAHELTLIFGKISHTCSKD